MFSLEATKMRNRFQMPVQNPTSEVNAVQVTVGYQRGGTNWFHGGEEPGGFFLHVTPIQDKGDGMFTWVIGRGGKHLLQAAKRDSKKTVAKLEAAAFAQMELRMGPAWDIACKVMAREGFQLEAAKPAADAEVA